MALFVGKQGRVHEAGVAAEFAQRGSGLEAEELGGAVQTVKRRRGYSF